MLQWDFQTYEQTVPERIAVQEVDVVLLDQRELPTVLEDIIVFKTGFRAEEELSFYGSELRPETKA